MMRMVGVGMVALGVAWAMFGVGSFSGRAVGQQVEERVEETRLATRQARKVFLITVTDGETGKPVAGAEVRRMVVRSGWPGTLVVEKGVRAGVTDAAGRVEMGDCLFGIVVSHERYLGRTISIGGMRDIRERTGGDGEARYVVKLTAGPDVVGVVRDAEGKALAGVEVTGGEKRAKTNERGEFRIYSPKSYEDGAYIHAELDGFIPLGIRARPGGAAVEAVLERPYEVVVRVLSPEGKGVEKFGVHVEVPEFSASEARIGAESYRIEKGEARLVFFTPGKRTLCVVAEGWGMVEVPVEVERKVGPIVVKLAEGVAMSGRVSVADGKYAGGKVVLRPSKGGNVPTLSVAMKEDGTYRMEHIGAGTYEVKAQVPGKTDARAEVKVGGGAVEVPVLKVRGTGTVVGKGFWPNCGGSVYSEDGKVFRFRTDKDGEFRVEGVTVGKGEVSVSRLAGCLSEGQGGPVEVEEGETVMMEILQREEMPAESRPKAAPAEVS